ncbi:hypothetical protein ScPMuIL_007270, partial [Solemya velum]
VRETMHNPIVMPDIYSGQTKFKDWLIQFEVCKDINNWTDTQACKFMAVKLRGNALQTFTDIDEDHRNDYTSVVQTLRDRFDPDVDPGVYWAQLRNRVRKRGEPLSELASNIQRLVALAHPQADSHTRSGLSVQYFVEAMDDREIKRQLRRSKPVDMTQALKIALDEESYQKMDDNKAKVCSIADSKNFNTELEKQKRKIDRLEKQLAAFKQGYSEPPQRTQNAQRTGKTGMGAAPRSANSIQALNVLFVCARVGSQKLRFLVDTGSDVTVISVQEFETIFNHNTITLSKEDTSFKTANGEYLQIAGTCEINLRIGSCVYPHKVLVANIAEKAILGNDFLRQNRVVIDLSRNKLKIGTNTVQLYCDEGSFQCCKVTAARNFVIPPESEVVVEGLMHKRGSPFCEGVVESVSQLRQNHPQLMVAKTLVDCELSRKVPVRLLNITSEPAIVQEGSRIGMLYPVQNEIHSVPSNETNASTNKDEVKTGSALPIKQRAYRLPVHKREEVDKQVESMLEQGIVSPSLSPWASPIVLVEKKHDTHKSYRFCVDYRKLNKVTKVDAYPLPRIDDTIDVLSGSQYFSTLDLASGFWQMGLSEKAKEKTAFTTGYGLYHFNVLPFGLCNAPSSFERLMERVLSGLHWKICLIYIDDIIIYSQTFDQHMDRIQQVLDCLHEAGLKLKPQKCHLFKTEVLYLGFIVSNAGVKTDPDKIERIRSWPTPCNITDVRSFLGLCCYYRKFVDNFSDIAVPLYNLTKKNTRFHWDKQCQEAFNTLKVALQESVILQYPQFDQPFILDTDSSDHSSGAILSQLHEGEEKVISYYSTTHSAPERKYSVTRKELLAVIKAIKHFRHYLYGREFVLRTDHASLRWLMGFKEPQGQIARWLEFLSSYQFTIEHRVGSKHLNADALSRIPVCSTITFDQFGWSKTDILKFQSEDPVLQIMIELLKKHDDRPHFNEISSDNKDVKSYWIQWEQLELSNDVLYRKWFDPATNETRKLLIVPPEMRNEILTLAHDSTTGGHFGIKKTRDKIRQIFYWLGMRKDVTDWIKTCTICQTRKSPVPKFRAPLVNIQSSEPMEIVAIDITGPFPVTSRDNKYILVVGDLYSKWIESYPIPDQEAKTVAQVLTYKFFTRFGVPKQLHSDQGGNFESKLFKELCSLLGINKTRTTAYRPESDGMIERFNRTMKNILSKYVQADQSDWDLHLPTVTMAYRSSIHETTGVTPNFMMLGREINTPLNIMVELPSDLPKTSVEFVAKMQEKFQSSFDLVRNQVSTQQRRQKLNYDKKISGKAFHVGDKVWLYVPRSAKGLSPKLTRFWTGPFDIIQKLSDVNYVISQPDSRKKQVVHFNRLKPCFLRDQSGDTSIEKSLNGSLSADMGESVETDVLPEYEMEN